MAKNRDELGTIGLFNCANGNEYDHSLSRIGAVPGDGMRLSIVIPSYNMAVLLGRTLEFLAAQHVNPAHTVEIVVVDDGSSDETRTIVESFRTRLHSLHYIFRPRDEASCRARARNLGIERSSGELLVLLDCGILVEDTFVERTIARHLSEEVVCIHMVAGLDVDGADGSPESVDMTPANLRERCEHLLCDPVWRDERKPVFDLLGGDLRTLPGCWALAWSCALSLPREWALDVGGFDDSFVGWGAEDDDFACRLHHAGHPFVAATDAISFHIPHSLSDRNAPLARAKLGRLHQKQYLRESELFMILSGFECCFFCQRLDQLVLEYALPSYAPGFVRTMLQYVAPEGETIAVGVPDAYVATSMPTTHMLVHNRSVLGRMKQSFPRRTIACLLGLQTPYRDKQFETLVCTDFMRLLPPKLIALQLTEFARIARRVLITFSSKSEGRAGRFRLLCGWNWAGRDELTEAAKATHRGLTTLARWDDVELLTLE